MWLFALLAVAAEPSAALTLDEAMDRAAAQAASVRAAELSVQAAGAQSVAARSAYLPMVQGQFGMQVWDSKAEFSFAGDSGGEAPDCSAIPAPFDALCSSLGTPMVVREQVTWSATARVIQPVTGVISGVLQHKAALAGVDAARAAQAQAVWSARFQTADAWYGAREAEAQLEVARAQVQALQARQAMVQASVDAGAAVKNDLLQVSLAVGRARQGELAVGAMVDAARRRLSVTLGGDGTPVAPIGDLRAPDDAALPAEDTLVDLALGRPELVSVRERAEAARWSALATSWSRLPSVSVLGSFTHQQGQALGQPQNSGFFGVNAEWTVWAWDRQAAQARAARAQAAQADVQLQALEAAARLEVATRRTAVETARSSWAVSQDAVAQADENLSLFRLRYERGAATTLELLDAEASATRARSEEVGARIGLLRAEAALALAIGAEI